MIRRRLPSLLAFLMLLASLSSTEASEIWSRVAVASIPLPEAAANIHALPTERDPFPGLAIRSTLSAPGVCSAALSDEVMPDIPAWTFFDAPVLLAPRTACLLDVALTPVAYGFETRGPPVVAARFIRPPLRAPPTA